MVKSKVTSSENEAGQKFRGCAWLFLPVQKVQWKYRGAEGRSPQKAKCKVLG